MIDRRGITKGVEPPSIEDLENGNTNMDIVSKLPTKDDGDNTTRSAAAVSLKLSGASYTDIAKVLGYEDAYRARTAVERALADSAEPTDVASLRAMHLKRLDRLLRSTWEKAINPNHPDHLAYVRTALVVMERAAKVAGVDAPSQVAVSVTPEHLQQWVEAVARLGGAPQAIEADIMDVEIIEDAVLEANI